MMRTLLTAPFVGEIGWELMSWQGFVRRTLRRGSFDRLVVLGEAGRRAFYADMPLEYREVDLSALPGAAYEDRRYDLDRRDAIGADLIRDVVAQQVNEVAAALRRTGDVEVLWPSYNGRIMPCTPEYQSFVSYRHTWPDAPAAPLVLLVQRHRALAAENNWPPESWNRLAGLLEARGVAARDYPCEAQAAIEALSACDLAVGPSTGGLHLASLCHCPHVVWSNGDETTWTPWQITNRQRYETFWNPLATPVEYHGVSEAPDPRQVAEWVLGALQRIGRRTGSAVHRCRLRAGWSARWFVGWRVLASEALRRCPWPMQKWLRYGLL